MVQLVKAGQTPEELMAREEIAGAQRLSREWIEAHIPHTILAVHPGSRWCPHTS
jgi:hypothetical protein